MKTRKELAKMFEDLISDGPWLDEVMEGTESGDIAPDQVFKLVSLGEELADLWLEIRRQNMPGYSGLRDE